MTTNIFELRVTILLIQDKNDHTIDTHVLVVGFHIDKCKMTSSGNGVYLSKTAAQTQMLMF